MSRSPRRAPSSMVSRRSVPPPPYVSVLRASSLAAVTIFVWSTRLKPSSTARCLTAWRAPTTSSADLTGRSSLRRTGNVAPPAVDAAAQQIHAALDVERRPYPVQRQPELHERDRDGRLHTDDHRLGVEDARHRSDVAEHAADEGIDHLERGDVDEDAFGARADDPGREIVLQRHRHPVVHVHLDGHEEV